MMMSCNYMYLFLGPVHTYPDIFKTEIFFLRLRPHINGVFGHKYGDF